MTLDESAPPPPPAGDADIERRRKLPVAVAQLLRAARADEQQALGGQRRAAYLFTRNVISGVVSAGFAARLVADELGVTSESLRTRAQPGPMRLSDIAALAGVDIADLESRCHRAGAAVESGSIHSDELVAVLLTP
jgi:hypothetical protein